MTYVFKELKVHLQSAVHQTSNSSVAPEDLNRALLSPSSTMRLCCYAGSQEKQHGLCIAERATHAFMGKLSHYPAKKVLKTKEEMGKHLCLSNL